MIIDSCDGVINGWSESLCFRAHQEVVEESFLPTMRTLMNAPATSPLAEVDINNVVELLVELTRPSVLIKAPADTGVRDIPGPSFIPPPQITLLSNV